MLKLKHQLFGHLMSRANSLEKTLIVGKNEGRKRREQQRMSYLDGIINSMDMNLSEKRQWKTKESGKRQPIALQGIGHDLVTEKQVSSE